MPLKKKKKKRSAINPSCHRRKNELSKIKYRVQTVPMGFCSPDALIADPVWLSHSLAAHLPNHIGQNARYHNTQTD